MCIFLPAMKPDFVRKMEDFEVKEQEVAILEVEISSETADVVWVKVRFLFISILYLVDFSSFSQLPKGNRQSVISAREPRHVITCIPLFAIVSLQSVGFGSCPSVQT